MLVAEIKKVNLSARKTEAEWSKANDDFFLKATPIWFDWLKWIFIMGAIQVIADKTHDRSVQLIMGTSYFFFMFYMFAYFYNIEFHGIPLIKSERIRRIVSIIISMLIFSCVFYLLTHLANLLKT